MEKIFREVVKIVESRTGIEYNELIYSKKQEHVDGEVP